MKTIGVILALSFIASGIAACNNTYDTNHNHHPKSDVYFSGVHGDSKGFCGPAQRHNRTCY